MFRKALPLTLFLLVVASLLIVDVSAGRRHGRGRHRRDPRIRLSDLDHHDFDDDDDDDDHHRDKDEDKDDDDDDDDDGDHHEGDDRDRDPAYDHEAFLGREEAHRFDDLTPVQAQKALIEMVPKIDANGDSKISPEEMQAWLEAVHKRERRIAADKRFETVKLLNHALDVNAPMTFEEYKGALHHAIVGKREDKKVIEEFNNQLVRDQARWAKADLDGDKLLNKAEFADFLRPEEAPHMRDIVIQEAMMSADKNKDGKVDVNEYLTVLHPTYEADVKEKKKLPKWIAKEEKRFKEKLDTNKDGTLDPNEVYKWIVPDDYDHSRQETQHLFKIADKDNDKYLTRDEILDKWQTFVGAKQHDSQASSHDEL